MSVCGKHCSGGKNAAIGFKFDKMKNVVNTLLGAKLILLASNSAETLKILFTQLVIKNGRNQSKDTTCVQYNLRSSLFSKIKVTFFFVCCDKNFRVYSVASLAAPVQKLKIGHAYKSS